MGHWFTRVAHEHNGFEVTVTDLAALNLPLLDEPSAAIEGLGYEHQHTRDWSATVAASDAFVFILPEYNQGYPASIKNALDYLYPEWTYKPVGFVSYGMSSGGLRSAAALRPVVTALKMMPVTETVVIYLRRALDGDGQLVVTSSMEHAAKEMLQELMLMTTAFASIRS